MKKTTTLITIAIILLAVSMAVLSAGIISFAQTENSDKLDNYSYTKAICTKDNFCQDYVLVCKNKNLESINPVASAVIQFSPNWKDPRTQEQIDKECE